MNSNNMNENQNNGAKNVKRRKRVQRIKTSIIWALVIALLIPIILCIQLMTRLNKLEKRLNEIEELREEENGEFFSDAIDFGTDSSVAYAKENEKKEDEETNDTNNTKDTNKDKKNELTEEEKLDKEIEKNKVYLTFDDGPGKYSDELLDVLKENDVKATFFVIGRTDKQSLRIYKRIVDEGHTLAMHSYSHQYSKIYASEKAFAKDFKKIEKLLYETTGVRPTVYRFPGGSSNTVSKQPMTKFIKYLNDKNVTYYDWNVINGDATGKSLTEKQMIANVMDGVKKNNNSMVLMHDTYSKDTTVKSMPKLIKKLKKQGYVILPITKYTKPVQHIKADSVK